MKALSIPTLPRSNDKWLYRTVALNRINNQAPTDIHTTSE